MSKERKQKGNPHIIIFSIWLMVFASSSQIMIISPILPRISEQLNIASTLLGTLVTSYAIMVGIFALITGPISDKLGRRRILLYGSGGMSIALLLHSLAFDYYSLLTFRAIAGAAGGILSGSAVAYVGDYFPYEKRGWANGWIMSGIAAGQILGIPMGTVLAEHTGFKMSFIAFGIVMSAAFLLIYYFVPQPNVTLHKGRITLLNSLKKYIELIKSRQIMAASATYLLMFFSISVYIVFLPTWLEAKFNVSGDAIATIFFVGGLANVLVGPQAGKLSDKLGRKNIIIFSCYGTAITMAITTFIIVEFWHAYILFFITMVLVAARISPFQALITELVSSERRGIMMSLMISIGQIGYGLGGAISGPAYVKYGYVSNTYIGTVIVIAMGLIIWKFLPEPELKSNYKTPKASSSNNKTNVVKESI